MEDTPQQQSGAEPVATQQEEIVPTIVTHTGVRHADETMAIAIISMIWPKAATNVLRTRDRALIDSMVNAPAPTNNPDKVPHLIVVDVGGQYDPEKFLFDHHQPGGAGGRDSGVPYAAAGLVWERFGMQALSAALHGATPELIPDLHKAVDYALIQGIDAADVGVAGHIPPTTMTFSRMISMKNAGIWHDPKMIERMETEQFRLAFSTLSDVIRTEWFKLQAASGIRASIEAAIAKGSKFAFFSLYSQVWPRVLFETPGSEHLLYVIYRDLTDEFAGWRVQCVPVEGEQFSQRKPFPDAWRGLEGDRFREVTGVEDGLFCHPRGFIVGAESQEGAVRLTQLALEAIK